jgi:hypothetical protein
MFITWPADETVTERKIFCSANEAGAGIAIKTLQLSVIPW